MTLGKIIGNGMLIFGLAGCQTLMPSSFPANVRTYESKVDNVKHIDASPGYVPGSMFRLGVNYSSNMKPEEIIITVASSSIVATKDGLVINLDGKKSTYSAIDDIADYDSEYGVFRKRFVVPRSLIKEMLDGKSVFVKIEFNGQTYAEGEFSQDQMNSAKRSFRNFMEEFEGPKTRIPSSN